MHRYPWLRLIGVAGILTAVLLLAPPVRSDTTLTSAVNAAFIPHTEDATLHQIAHERAVEIASDFSHEGRRDGTAEVLAWNSGSDDPVALAVSQWLGSPSHAAILSDPSYTLIGCGSAVVGDASYFACVLTAGAIPVPAPPAEVPYSPPAAIPNTATDCRPEPVTEHTPTGIAGCVIYGEGTASHWPGPGVARNDCVYPWTECQPIRITSLATGLSIVVTPSMFCDCYTGTSDQRIVDLDPAAAQALGLDWSQGLYPVTVEPVTSLPNTAMRTP